MRRLEGKKEVERILFGRELFGLRRRRICATCVYAVIFGLCIFAVIFAVLSMKREDADKGYEAGEELTFENIADEGTADNADTGGDTGDVADNTDVTDATETGGGEQETDGQNGIIYNDFSTAYLNIKNNTVFDISFVNSEHYTLPKYYNKNDSRPIVLILHTYTSDRYYDSDGKYGVCAVGRTLCDELNSMGIGAVYSSAVHDNDLNNPEENARDTIEFYLKMYPSIKYVFDVGIAEEYDGDRIVATSGVYMGEAAAQIKFAVAGNNMASGRDNLLLAVGISKNLSLGSMTLAREIVYEDSIKNSTHTPYYLEIFIGSSGNCEQEAQISTRILASAFAQLLV